MGLERYTFGFAGNVFPAATGTGNTALHDLDRVVFELLDFYAFTLTNYLGARWTEAATAAQLTSAQASSIVAYKVPYDPRDHLQEDGAPFPMLSVYRVSERFSRETSAWMQAKVTLGIDWSLPPLTSAQVEMLGPFLHAVGKVLAQGTELGKHPSYQSGADVYANAGLQDVTITDAAYGSLISQSNQVYPSIHLTLAVTERQMPVAGAFSPITGVDVALDAKASDGTTVADVVDVTLTP